MHINRLLRVCNLVWLPALVAENSAEWCNFLVKMPNVSRGSNMTEQRWMWLCRHGEMYTEVTMMRVCTTKGLGVSLFTRLELTLSVSEYGFVVAPLTLRPVTVAISIPTHIAVVACVSPYIIALVTSSLIASTLSSLLVSLIITSYLITASLLLYPIRRRV